MAAIENELKVRSLRIDENTFEKFKNIANQEFGNQGQCLSALVNLYETENSKNILLDRKVEIESFQMYINKLNELFISSLSLNQDTEERVKSNFEKLLMSKDNIIADLQERLGKSISSTSELKDSINTVKNQFEIKDKRVRELEEILENTIEQYSKNIEEKDVFSKTMQDSLKEKTLIIQNLSSEIASLKNEIAKTEEYKSENKILTNSISEYKSKISSLEEQIEIQKNNYEYKSDIIVLNMEKEKQKIVSDIQQSHNNSIREYMQKIEDINLKYDSERNSLNNTIQELISKSNRYELENDKLIFEIQKLNTKIQEK